MPAGQRPKRRCGCSWESREMATPYDIIVIGTGAQRGSPGSGGSRPATDRAPVTGHGLPTPLYIRVFN